MFTPDSFSERNFLNALSGSPSIPVALLWLSLFKAVLTSVTETYSSILLLEFESVLMIMFPISDVGR